LVLDAFRINLAFLSTSFVSPHRLPASSPGVETHDPTPGWARLGRTPRKRPHHGGRHRRPKPGVWGFTSGGDAGGGRMCPFLYALLGETPHCKDGARPLYPRVISRGRAPRHCDVDASDWFTARPARTRGLGSRPREKGTFFIPPPFSRGALPDPWLRAGCAGRPGCPRLVGSVDTTVAGRPGCPDSSEASTPRWPAQPAFDQGSGVFTPGGRVGI
jgi:hypothetical protein